MNNLIKCYGCGALVEDIPGKPHEYIGATAGCWEVYKKVLLKGYGKLEYSDLTQHLIVDTYSVQHPGKPKPDAIRSINLHLIGLHLLFKKEMSVPDVATAIEIICKRANRFVWLEPPIPNGSITVLDVAKAKNLAEHRQLVEEWARDVWEAWLPYHALVKHMVKKYFVQ
ncbi:MAG: hypothetical protein GXO76_04245 [Calditrichaeota bacterium]|nr:hypothetical protein [Calditrichota bacterium]